MLKKTWDVFWGVDEGSATRTRKGIWTAILFPAVQWVDWLLVGVTAMLVVFLKSIDFSDLAVFAVLWVGNVLVSWSVVFANDKTGIDLTLMQGLRRLVDATTERSRFFGIICEAVVLVRLTIWDGPDQLFIYFRKHLPQSTAFRVSFFLGASGVQMAIWTLLYVSGYEEITQLITG